MFVSTKVLAKARALGLLDQQQEPVRKALPWEDPNNSGYMRAEFGDVAYFKKGRRSLKGKVTGIIPAGESAEDHRPAGVPKSRFKYTKVEGKSGRVESFKNTRRAIMEVDEDGKMVYYVVTLLENQRWTTGFMLVDGKKRNAV